MKFLAYVNQKTRSKHDRHDELVLRGREGGFPGYSFSENTLKHPYGTRYRS